jgi:Tfp pilus assembly PilM family ATPase
VANRIGLDIGSTAVRAVELTGGDSPSVIRAVQVPLPAEAVDNGEVRD